MVRIALSTGKVRERDAGLDEEALLREHVATGRVSERRAALAAAEERRVSGLVPVLEGQLDSDEGRSEIWRLEVAAALLRQTDHARAWETLLAALAPERSEDVRRLAANALHRSMGNAPPERRAAVVAKARDVPSPEARWLVEQSGS
jgi:hypothetical protein